MNHKSPKDAADPRFEAGLSTIETTMVFLIIATVLAFALPAASSSIRAYNTRSAANHLSERISAVRALAMAKNRNVTFSFNNGTGQYGFDFTPAGAPDGTPDTSDPDDPTLGSYYVESLPSGVTATFPNNAPIMVTFNSRGELPIEAAAQNIALQSYGNTATVSVNLRGKISVQ